MLKSEYLIKAMVVTFGKLEAVVPGTIEHMDLEDELYGAREMLEDISCGVLEDVTVPEHQINHERIRGA